MIIVIKLKRISDNDPSIMSNSKIPHIIGGQAYKTIDTSHNNITRDGKRAAPTHCRRRNLEYFPRKELKLVD